MIRVLHVTEDHSARNTGISSAVDMLARAAPPEIKPAIACVGEETLPAPPGVEIIPFPTGGLGRFWRYSPGNAPALADAIARSDVIHLHGLWMWAQWAGAREGVRQVKPIVLTPHGMLERWIWKRQSWAQQMKKWLYWEVFARPAFRKVAVVHALTEIEARTLASYFPGQKICLIPHGIDLEAADRILEGLPAQTGKETPYLLFVGRLHPVKGLHLLLRAFARLPQNNLKLVLAGPTQPQEQAYALSLRHLADELGLGGRVSFPGAVQGAAKWQLYRDAWAFCLPSFSEVIGMVNLEAAAASTPAMTTFESGVVAAWDEKGGLRVHPDEESILAGLKQVLGWTVEERKVRGASLRGLVENEYSFKRVGGDWASVYRKLTGGDRNA